MDTNKNDILSAIRNTCLLYPDNIAVEVDGKQCVTYAKMWSNALRIANYISSHSQAHFIGLQLGKSIAHIECMIGCWMAGRAFVPIGSELPVARRQWMMNDADIDICIDGGMYSEALGSKHLNQIHNITFNQPAYVIYSSGTTGVPKGIVVPHAGLYNLAKCQSECFGVSCKSRSLLFLSLNFDASISDILVALTSGAALVVETMPHEQLTASLLQVLTLRKITHIDLPPSLLKLIDPKLCPPLLQTIIIGGEAADINTVREWSKKVNLVNVYGPTEATICTSQCKCNEDWNLPLLGKPLNNIHYDIYANGQLGADEGELWISGIGLALGYVNNRQLTDKKFVTLNGTRYYRTSDLVRRTVDGEFIFLGRIDRQVKHNGQLIELEEIETVLKKSKLISNAAVVKRRLSDQHTKDVLVAFLVPNTSVTSLSEYKTIEQSLRRACEQALPKWMMPAVFQFLEHFPTTPSGKVDLQELQKCVLSFKTDECKELAYSTADEQNIASIMAKVLKMPAVGADDDFFLSGGDSLDAITFQSMLHQSGYIISPSDLRYNATPHLLAQISGKYNGMAIHSSVLQREWMDFQYPIAKCSNHNATRILVTGATGFLGAHLLSKLLNNTNAHNIVCLVRASNSSKGLERIKGAFLQYHLDSRMLNTVEIVCGDISMPFLGLDATQYFQLQQSTAEVYHCAATVNMIAPYKQLENANVMGTKNMVYFALSHHKMKLHYASTLSVFVSTGQNTGVVYETDRLTEPTNIYGGYAQTKYVAEKIVLGIPQEACDVFVYRFGLLCGDSMYGIFAPKDFLSMFFKGAKAIGVLPFDSSDAMAVDVTPIDSAVKVMTDIAMTGKPDVYHIASENPLKYNDLCNTLLQCGLICDITTDYATWKKAMTSLTRCPEANAVGLSLCRLDERDFEQMRYMDLFQTTDIRFDMTNTHLATNERCRQNKMLIKLYIKPHHETI